MALVPSGRWRLMVAQTMANDPAHNGVGQAAAPAGTPAPQPRNNVQQEEIGGNGMQADPSQQGGVGEEGMPAENMDNPGGGGDFSVQPVEQQQEQQKEDHKESTLKKFVYETVAQLGITPRQMNAIPDFYSQENDLTTHKVSGHYYLPTHTSEHEVDERMAMQVAQKIGQQFGLAQKMRLETKDSISNWKITFETQPQAHIEQNGSSFDVLQKQNPKGNPNLSRAASTMGEMIKARKDDLYDIMRKIAKGN